MNIYKKIINKILGKETILSGLENIKVWKTNQCYDCSKPINTKSCWQRFIKVGEEMFRVNICNECNDKL